MPVESVAPCAIVLAAGIGARLGEAHNEPKILLEFGGRSLIERHLDALARNGIRDLVVTVGHGADRLRAVLAGRAETVLNPDYRQGSMVSLWVQRDRLRSGRTILLMDGDVLYDARMIERLRAAEGEAVVLVDRELEPGDEPVKVCFRDGRMVDFRKRPTRAHDWHGESVGFFKFSPAMATALADTCEAYMATGRKDVEYEEAIRDLMLVRPDSFTHVDITDLPWTEIDFPEDAERARNVILPSLVS